MLRRCRLVLHEAVGQCVAQQHDVADRPSLGEGGAPVGAPGEHAVADETGRARVSDEEGSNREVEFVDEVPRQELCQRAAAAFHHEALRAPFRQVAEQIGHHHLFAQRNDGRRVAELTVEALRHGSGAVHELRRVVLGEEGGLRIEVARRRNGHLPRRPRQTGCRAAALPLGAAHEQARVVASHGTRPHEDGVIACTHLIDPVEIRRVREGEPRRPGRVEVPVEGDCAAEGHVRTVGHHDSSE